MILLYLLLAAYIFAVNFLGYRLLRAQRDGVEAGEREPNEGDGKLLLAAALGGAIAMYAAMFFLRYRLENCLFMIILPLLSVLNLYAFYLGFRGIAFL